MADNQEKVVAEQTEDKKQSFSFKDFSNTKNFYRIIALIVAICMWFYVDQSQTTIEERLLDVPIEYLNIAEDLSLSEQVTSVKVRVRGDEKVFEELVSRDIAASVDLSGATIGQYTGKVLVSLPNGLELSSVNPSNVSVQIQATEEVQVPIEVVYIGESVASGYTALDPVISPSQVLISGSQDKIEDIASAYVVVDASGAVDNINENLPVYVSASNGQSLNEYLTVSPAEVSVFIPVVTDQPSSIKPIKVPFTGKLSNGYTVSRVVLSEEVVRVFGEYAVLNALDYMYTTSVDYGNRDTDFTTEVALQIPANVTVADNVHTLTAFVAVEPIVERNFDDLVINIGNKDDHDYTLSVQTADITVYGAKSHVENLTVSDLRCYVDVSGLAPGSTYLVPITIQSPTGITVKTTAPQVVNVMVE